MTSELHPYCMQCQCFLRKCHLWFQQVCSHALIFSSLQQNIKKVFFNHQRKMQRPQAKTHLYNTLHIHKEQQSVYLYRLKGYHPSLCSLSRFICAQTRTTGVLGIKFQRFSIFHVGIDICSFYRPNKIWWADIKTSLMLTTVIWHSWNIKIIFFTRKFNKICQTSVKNRQTPL